MKKRAIPLIVASTIVILATACMVWLRAAPGAAVEDQQAPAACEDEGCTSCADEPHAEEEGMHLEGVETIRVTERMVPQYITLSAEVEANAERTARVGSPVDGRIVALKARIGDSVRKGQTLAVVASRDVADVQAALARARAQEKASGARLGTLRELARTGALTDVPLEEARREHTGAMASVQEAEASLARANKAREAAVSELGRVKQLAAAGAYRAGPAEDAKRDLASARAKLDTARAHIRVRKAAYSRLERLVETGLVARREVESAEADLAEAEAQEREAQTHLEIAEVALKREQGISGQDLHSISQVRQVQNAVDDADKDVRSAGIELERARRHLSLTASATAREERVAKADHNARRELQALQTELSLARAQVSAAQAGLSAFRAAGGKSTGGPASIAIVAPLAGVVTARDVSAGQAIQASQDLFTIESIDPVWVWAAAYEKDLASIPVGVDALTRVRSYGDQVFAGKVTHIARALNEEARTARIRCEVPNPDGVLRPGMFASVDIMIGGEKPAILLPREAVLDEAGRQIVFIECADCPEDEKAGKSVCGSYDKVEVEAGPRHGDEIEIAQGLTGGASVVVTGQYQLKTAMGSGTLEAGCADEH